jgi:hypothetical protein
MGKTLRNIVAGSMIVGSLLFSGCGVQKKAQEAVSSIVDEAMGEQGSYDKALNQAQEAVRGKVVEEAKPKAKPIDYLFQGNELRFLELSKYPVSKYNFEEGGALMVPWEFVSGTFSSNPVIINTDKLDEGEIKEFFKGEKIKEFEWAQYEIPERESTYYSKEHTLNLFIFKFGSKNGSEEFLRKNNETRSNRFPLFVGGNVISMFYEPTFTFVYSRNFLTPEQRIIYMDLIFDYQKRTKMELILSSNKDDHQTKLDFLNKLKKEYSFELRRKD